MQDQLGVRETLRRERMKKRSSGREGSSLRRDRKNILIKRNAKKIHQRIPSNIIW